MSERNLTLLTDYYEFTMSNGYYVLGRKDQRAAFDVFYRENPSKAGFSIFGGLQQIIDFLFSKVPDILYLICADYAVFQVASQALSILSHIRFSQQSDFHDFTIPFQHPDPAFPVLFPLKYQNGR